MPKLISKSFKTEKGCHVRRIKLDSKAGTALVGYDCGEGGSGWHQHPGGGQGNYPETRVTGVRSVDIPGGHVSGNADFGFVLSPCHVKCFKTASSDRLMCNVYNEAGPLTGARGRRRRRR